MTEQTVTESTRFPWELPEGWKEIALESVISRIATGTTPPSKEISYYGGDIPWFSPSDIGSEKLLYSSTRTISQKAVNDKRARLFSPRSLLITCIGDIGKVGLSGDKCSANQQITGISFKEAIDPEYAYWWFRYRRQDLQAASTSSTLPIINQAKLKTLVLRYPTSLETQRRIVARIEELLAKVKEARAILEEMRRDTDRMMEAALTKTLKVLDAEFPDSPSVGDLVSAGRIAMFGGGTPSKSIREYWIGSIPWVSPKDMKRWKINDAMDHVSQTAVKESSVKLIPEGAVLVVTRGMILAHTWPVAVTTATVTINQDMKALSPKGHLLPKYLGYVLRARAPDVLRQVEIAAHGTRRLKTDKLASVVVPNAPEEVQRSIINHLDHIQSEVGRMQSVLDEEERLLDKLERSILDRAFRGEL